MPRIDRRSRLMVLVATLLLATAYILPLWRIELDAPQYPEGLGLRIWINQVTGVKPNDLNSINNLNHYIGMRRIDPDAIPELRLMPWFIAVMIGLGQLAVLAGRRWLLTVWAALLGLGAMVGIADFWKWGYDYGHQLDPTAAIKIPGMTYQPPLIGTKQLLNFHATSWPDVAGWLAILAVGLAAGVTVLEWRRARVFGRRAAVRGLPAREAVA